MTGRLVLISEASDHITEVLCTSVKLLSDYLRTNNYPPASLGMVHAELIRLSILVAGEINSSEIRAASNERLEPVYRKLVGEISDLILNRLEALEKTLIEEKN